MPGIPEVEGTLGQWDREGATGQIQLVETVADVWAIQVRQPSNLAYTTQTTLSVDETIEVIDALRQRFPEIQGPRHDDICYATQNRQDAVRELSKYCDRVLVVGSPNSSNSNRLRELAERNGVPAYLIDGAADIRLEWLEGARCVGVTAGASAPESLVHGVVERLRHLGQGQVRELDGVRESMVFALPKELRVVVEG
jgi:4-hydroxy-3-methylbut-2-enyl diphosphate reductase